MKKLFKFIKCNIKTFIAFIIGVVIAGGTVYAATIASNSVQYDNSKSGSSKTTVQDAIDELYDKAANSGVPIDPSYIDFATINTNTAKSILASSKGICIFRNNKLNCFKRNNWAEEEKHIKEVFSDISCFGKPTSYVGCYASDFSCIVYTDGRVRCDDESDRSYCIVNSGGSIERS